MNAALYFRQFAPNFGVRQLAYGVLVPNEFLDPVTADNFEVGARWRTAKWWGSVAGYYTKFNNFQNIVRGTYQGQDWYDYNNNNVRDPDEDVYVTTGNGDAYVYGVELEAGFRPGELFPDHIGTQWSLWGGFMWNYGNDQENHEPIRHTHPARALFKLRWDDTDEERGIWWEFAADFVRHYGGTAKRQIHREVPFRASGESGSRRGAPEPASPGATPSQEFLRRDDELRLVAALEKLAPDYQEVILLRNLQRLPFNDVAEQMGRSRPAVQMLWKRAIDKLREVMKDEP